MADNKVPPELLAKFKADREEKGPSGDEVKMGKQNALARSFKKRSNRLNGSLSEVRNKFEEILEAARTQGQQNQAATMVVLSHLQQMTLLMIKKVFLLLRSRHSKPNTLSP